jgi:hypothetical protein
MANRFEIEAEGGRAVITLWNDKGHKATRVIKGHFNDDQLIQLGFQLKREYREAQERRPKRIEADKPAIEDGRAA